MHALTRILTLVAAVFAVSFSAPAIADDFDLKTALKSKQVKRVCGDADRITGTLRFLNDQSAEPNTCSMYRFLSRNERQCECLKEVLVSADTDADSFLLDRGMTDQAIACDASMSEPVNQPEVCAEGCDCDSSIRADKYR